MDEFTAFVLFGGLVALGILLAIGRWYPGSGAEQVDWRPTRSPEVEAELELTDVDQMIEAQNTRRRATGRGEITEADIRAQVAADQRWRDELRRRARESAAGPPDADAPPDTDPPAPPSDTDPPARPPRRGSPSRPPNADPPPDA